MNRADAALVVIRLALPGLLLAGCFAPEQPPARGRAVLEGGEVPHHAGQPAAVRAGVAERRDPGVLHEVLGVGVGDERR